MSFDNIWIVSFCQIKWNSWSHDTFIKSYIDMYGKHLLNSDAEKMSQIPFKIRATNVFSIQCFSYTFQCFHLTVYIIYSKSIFHVRISFLLNRKILLWWLEIASRANKTKYVNENKWYFSFESDKKFFSFNLLSSTYLRKWIKFRSRQ